MVEAEKPTEIPAKGWLAIVKRGWAEAKVDQVPLMGAGVAFFAFLALFRASSPRSPCTGCSQTPA